MRKLSNKSTKPSLLEAAKPGQPLPVRAWTPLFFMALVVAAAIIGVVVWLTPKPPDDPELIEQMKAEYERKQTPQAAPPASTASTIDLPTQATPLEDPALFALLQKVANEAVQRLPEEPAALHIAALIHSELKQTADAEKLWQRCLAIGTKQLGPYLAYADLLIKLGRGDEAEQLLANQWPMLSTSPEAVRVRSQVLDQLGEPEQAVALLEKSLQTNPQEVDNWLQLGQLQNQLRQYAEAESSLRTAVALGMTANETLLFALSTAVGRQNRPDEAKQLLEAFQKLKDTSADPSGNRFQEAYSTALNRIGVRALLNASAMYNEVGHPDWAEQTAMELLRLDPEHVTALMTLSSILRKTGRIADARVVHEKILSREPDNPYNVINLASLQVEMGEVESAEKLLQEFSAKEPPDSGFLHAELARMYLNLQQYEDARTYAKLAVDRQPTIPFYSLLATACKALNDSGGVFEAVTAMERMEREQATAAGPTQPSGTGAQATPTEAVRNNDGPTSAADDQERE